MKVSLPFFDDQAADIDRAGLENARAPAQQLSGPTARGFLRQLDRFSILPEILILAGEDGQVGVVIDPFDLAAKPSAAPLLQADERVVGEEIGGGENLVLADDGAQFLDLVHPPAPGLEIVELAAGDLHRHERALPEFFKVRLGGGIVADRKKERE